MSTTTSRSSNQFWGGCPSSARRILEHCARNLVFIERMDSTRNNMAEKIPFTLQPLAVATPIFYRFLYSKYNENKAIKN